MMFQIVADTGALATPMLGAGGGFLPLWIVLGVFVFVALFFALHLLLRALRRPDLYGMTREKVKDMWKQIEHTSDQGVMGAKLAVIEADKLLDGVLKSMVMPGETLGERLRSAEYKYPNIKNVWPAHKLRNQLVHDSTFELSVRQAKSALKDFEAALKTLNVL
jgi:hypothetical protein